MIPGRTLHRVAARVCSAKTLEQVVEPAIADLQKEYVSTGAGRASRRVWVLLTGYAAIMKGIAMCAVSVAAPCDDEWNALKRTLVWSVALVTVIVVLLMLPALYGFDDAISSWYAATTLVPQAVPLAIPIGIAFGVAFGFSARPSVNLAKVTLLGALAASALSFVILVWGIPAANQAFREFTFRELRAMGYPGDINRLQKGHSEMTLPELRREIAHFSANGEPRRARQFAFALHLRFALAAAAFVLATVLLAAPVDDRGPRGLLTLTICVAYWALMFAGESSSVRGYLTPPFGAWLPNLVMISLAIFTASSRLRGSPTSPR